MPPEGHKKTNICTAVIKRKRDREEGEEEEVRDGIEARLCIYRLETAE